MNNPNKSFCCFYGADGHKLHAVQYKATKTRGIVLLVHGRNELNLKYEETCLELVSLGMDVYAYDHRYQGFNERPYQNKEVCHIDSFHTYTDDLECVINQLPKGLPVFLLAISMGGAITLLYLKNKKTPESLSGVIFVSPLIEPIYPHSPRIINLYAHIKKFLDRITFSIASPLYKRKPLFQPRIFGVNANTHDENRHNRYFELYNQFPQCRSGICSASWLLAMQAAVKEIKQANLIFTVPTLFLIGNDDSIVNSEATEIFLEKHASNPTPPISYRFAECYHDILIEQDGIRSCAIGCIENFIQSTMRQRLSRSMSKRSRSSL